MIKGKRNQLANVGNRFQTQVKKVVVVCSAGLLRSPQQLMCYTLNMGSTQELWELTKSLL